MPINVIFYNKNVEEGVVMDNNNWNTYEQGQFSSQTTQEQTSQQNTYPQYDGTQNTYQGYQSYQPVQEPQTDETVKISEYLLILLLCTFIPCAGIILLFVFAFSNKEKESKKNFCKAYLITIGINLVLAIIMAIIYVAAFAAMM